MAITETRALPAPFIEDLGKKYATDLSTLTGQAVPTAGFAPQVAPQDLATQEAYGLRAGLGAYAPYLSAAGTQAGTAAGTLAGVSPYISAAGTGLGAAGTELTGAGTTLAGVSPYITAAGTGLGTAGTELSAAGAAMGAAPSYISGAAGLTGTGAGTGAGSIASYMSPYQTQVIDETLTEFDRQAASRQQAISDQAVALGGYGGGREGVQLAEYQTQSDRNRALLQAQLQQQGFGQAQAARQQDYANQLGLAGAQQQYGTGLAGLAGQRAGLGTAQLGLGQAQSGLAGQQAQMAGQRAGLASQQLGLGQAQSGLAAAQLGQAGFQTQLASQAPQLAAQQISGLGSLGAAQQAQAQATLDAGAEAARLAAYEPYERLGFYGSGVTGLMGGYPAQYQFSSQPNPTPLQTALGTGAVASGIYKNIFKS